MSSYKNLALHIPLIFLVFTLSVSFSQNIKIRDLNAESRPILLKQKADALALIKTPAADSTRIQTLHLLSTAYVGLGDFDSALVAATNAYDLAMKLNDPRLITESLLVIGGVYGNFGSRNYEKSLYYYEQGAAAAEREHLYLETHQMYYSILNLYFYAGDFVKAMETTTKGLLLAETNNDHSRIAHYRQLYGFIYLRQGKLAEAEANYQNYLSHAVNTNDSITMADAYNCLADVYVAEKNFPKALEYHLRAWHVYSRHYYAGIHFKHDQMAYTAFKVSHVYKLLGDYDHALNFISKSFDFTTKHGTNDYDMAMYLLNAGEIYSYLGNEKQSLYLLHLGLKLSKGIKHLENIRDAYLLLSEIHRAMRRYDSAYHYQVAYSSMKDSILNERSLREIQRIHSEYDLQKKDQAIAMQQSQLDQQHFQRNALIVVFIFLAVIMFLLYNRYRLKQKNKFQAELTHQQNELFNTIVTFQDSERQRIAQDIHDSVGSVLSAAKLQLSALDDAKEGLNNEHFANYQAALSLIDQASQELRNISHNIMPAALSRLGLVAALENLIEKISDYSGVRINFNVYGFKERLAEKTEIGIYPVVLELINNVLKHAQASQATVQLVRHPRYINITVEDNGRGFDVKTKKGDGIGLKNVMSRIQYLKGTINIDSEEGQGTSIMIDIPY